MAKRTLASAIRKNRSDYYRLLAFEARENERIHHMKKRIKLLAEDEKISRALQLHLTGLLSQLQNQKTELEQAAPSKERDKTLKKVEKEFKEIDKKYKRNEHHLAVLESKKDKDNAAKLVLKEAKRDEISVRVQVAYANWKYFEQLEQQENIDFEAFVAQQQSNIATQITTSANKQPQPNTRMLTALPQQTIRFGAFVTTSKQTRPNDLVRMQPYALTNHRYTDETLFPVNTVSELLSKSKTGNSFVPLRHQLIEIE
ncbi:hypothetical protein QNI16_20870 [Cytophagaceae bacterium YF14B1]|uniref:Uncharacterized protein n=1 Tax=Xanthocytophaga flava TaxID=3048013 RepID=A0AAE3QT90_9BACT|nr:hypothetical protein [Xanthocytophaga flavus]MDJ1482968.1 hypothetical protein [Xanthocytophaga flavus]